MLETMRLTSGHSLIVPNTTESFQHCTGKSCNVLIKDSLESFGLFESNSPNFNNYYPDVTAADLQPQADEFIYPKFRALTATTIRPYAPIDFSKGNVLKSSMKKLKGVSIMTDHEQNTGNVLGAIKGVEWQDAYELDGVKIPAGIVVQMAIDGKSNPTIARGIMMDPPSYHSVSVTVSFEWEWSHEVPKETSPYSLWGVKMGDGTLMRKVATSIAIYPEISIVPMGADPFAKLLNDDKVVNPQTIKDRQSISASLKEAGIAQDAYVDFSNLESLSESYQYINNNKNDNDMTLAEFIASLDLGENLTEDQVKEQITELKATAAALAKLTAKKEDLSEDSLQVLIDNQKSEEDSTILAFVEENKGTENLTAVVEFQTNALAEKRTQAVNFYKLSVGDDAKEAIVKSIEESNGETLDAFADQYKADYEKQVPLTCTSCGSHEVSRKASEKADLGAEKQTLQETLLAAKRKEAVGRIHGKSSS